MVQRAFDVYNNHSEIGVALWMVNLIGSFLDPLENRLTLVGGNRLDRKRPLLGLLYL